MGKKASPPGISRIQYSVAGTNSATFQRIECRRRGSRLRRKVGQVAGPGRRDAREPTFSFHFPRHRDACTPFFSPSSRRIALSLPHARDRPLRKKKSTIARRKLPDTVSRTKRASRDVIGCALGRLHLHNYAQGVADACYQPFPSNYLLTRLPLPRSRHTNHFLGNRAERYFKSHIFGNVERILSLSGPQAPKPY